MNRREEGKNATRHAHGCVSLPIAKDAGQINAGDALVMNGEGEVSLMKSPTIIERWEALVREEQTLLAGVDPPDGFCLVSGMRTKGDNGQPLGVGVPFPYGPQYEARYDPLRLSWRIPMGMPRTETLVPQELFTAGLCDTRHKFNMYMFRELERIAP